MDFKLTVRIVKENKFRIINQQEPAKRRERISNLENGNPKLKDFTPRQLMDELISRGYRGELIYTQKIKL